MRSFVEMRMVDGVEIPMPVRGNPATAKTTRAYAAAALAFPYSPKRWHEREVQLPDGKIKIEKYSTSCPLSCNHLHHKFCPYHGEVAQDESHFIGLSCGDVMYARRAQLAAEGDLDSQIYLTDRIEGKPKQAIEANITNFSYSDVLSMLAAQEEDNPTTAPRITVDPFSTDMNTVHLNPFEEAQDVQVIPIRNKLLEQL